MKRLIVLIALALSACAASNLRPTPSADHPIIGKWTWTLPDGKCSETYDFRTDATTFVTSGEEVAESTYEISAAPSPNGFYKIVDTVTKTNGSRDCAGQPTPIGDTAINFIRIHPSGNMFLMCQNESLNACFGPLRRVP